LICGGITLLISIILLAFSFDIVKPTQYGLFQNEWTGVVDTDEPWSPGRHFIWLANSFITFPAYRVNVEFSSSATAHAPPVPARTGRDQNDPDSGGQPVTLSFSFQYEFAKQDVGRVYKEFGAQYETRFLLFARMAISDVAQEYTPGMFWKQRSAVAAEMEKKLVRMLRDYGYCQVTNFQLLHVKFPDKFEDMVTDIQLQVQFKLTSEYQQDVTRVIKDIDVLTSETQAQITSINANAAAQGALLVNEAKTSGFKRQQAAKAEAYKTLGSSLSLNTDEVLEYVKIRSLLAKRKKAKTVIGASQPTMVL